MNCMLGLLCLKCCLATSVHYIHVTATSPMESTSVSVLTQYGVVSRRYCLAVFPGIEDAVAEELAAHGLLATPGNPEPRALEYNDLLRLSYLKKVCPNNLEQGSHLNYYTVATCGFPRHIFLHHCLPNSHACCST